MLDNLENSELKKEIQQEVLCGKSEKIDMDFPSEEITLSFNYAEYEKAAREKKALSDITKCLSIKNSSATLEKQKHIILKELEIFKADNSELAKDKRFSDSYYFRLAEFYSLTKDYKKESECLNLIKNKQNSVYASKIAENELRKNEHTKENLSFLYNLNTSESARKLSAYYLAEKNFTNAEKTLLHYINTHDDIPYEIYFQYAFLFIQSGNANKAIHYLRLSFYTQNTAQTALALSMLYLVKATQNSRMIKKAQNWCEIAVNQDISFTPSLRLFVNLELGQFPKKTEILLLRYLSLNNAKENDFYFDAAINYAKCAFINKKYGEALNRLNNLIEDKTNPAAVWNNIAVCNEGVGTLEKLARAERNIAKSLEKLKNHTDLKNPNALEIILSNYMRILNKQGKYKETILLYENTSGAKEVKLSENTYLSYFAELKKALLATGDFETCEKFLCSVFDSGNLTLRLFACNDFLSIFTVYQKEEKANELKTCLNFLKTLYKNSPLGNYTVQILNNIVYTSIELSEPIPNDVFKDFVSTIGKNPYNTATYGLYLIRIKNQAERGLLYYDKAIFMAQKNEKYFNIIEQLKIKKEMEKATLLINNGETKSARRLLETIAKRCPQSLKAYEQNITTLLTKC